MNKLDYQEKLKELYFGNTKTKIKQYSSSKHIKNSNDIIKNISSQKHFSKLKQRAFLNIILKKILLKSHFEWISYAYIRSEKLIIYTKNHIAQSELNYQKSRILSSLNTLEKFKHIETVSIMRDNNYSNKQQIKNHIIQKYERSHGIFDNYITNERLSKIIERIRINIKNTNTFIIEKT